VAAAGDGAVKSLVPEWLGWPRFDWALLAGLVLLSVAGLFVLYSATGENIDTVYRQGVRLGLGFAALLILSQVPPYILRLWTPWLFALGIGLLVATWFFGVGRSTQRWLDFGLFRFQPSELMKLAVPMMVAWYLHSRRLPPGVKETIVAFILLLAPAALIIRQPDLGTALLVIISGCFTLFLAGLHWRFMAIVAGLALSAAPVLWLTMLDYQRNRVLTFLDPESDPLGTGWNIIQSKIAVGSGGLFGKGWQLGTQSHLEFIPERHTDFILAVLSEEFGFLGVLALFALYLFIAGRALYISSLARDCYSRLLAGSLALTFTVYVVVNGGMVSGLLPVVGIPLPLISYGGTSIVTLLAGFGILMSLYSHRNLIR
jgi:rod shape determining protein RodA